MERYYLHSLKCCNEWVCSTYDVMFCSLSVPAVAKSPCSPPERRISRSTQSCGSFSITPFTTSKENLPVLNTRIICPGMTTWHEPAWVVENLSHNIHNAQYNSEKTFQVTMKSKLTMQYCSIYYKSPLLMTFLYEVCLWARVTLF